MFDIFFLKSQKTSKKSGQSFFSFQETECFIMLIVLFDCLIALTRVNSMSPDFVVKRPFFIAKEGK